MAKPYSDDLRERVAQSVVEGRSARETARLFGVSVASAVKWSQRLRATGTAGARPMGGHPQTHFGGRASVAAGAAGRSARSDGAVFDGRAGRARLCGQPQHGLVVAAGGGLQLQKKACSPRSRTGQRSREDASSGRSIRVDLIRGVSSSSMKRGPRPT